MSARTTAPRAMGARRWSVAAFTVFTALASKTSLGAKWDVTTDIALRETYTDNVALTSPPESDLVTQVTPRLRASGRGARFLADVNYAPTVVHYDRRTESDGIFNSLGAFGRVEALERFFFVEGNASVGQSFISPLGPRPTDFSTITNNRIETRTVGLSPYIRGQTAEQLSYELRNR